MTLTSKGMWCLQTYETRERWLAAGPVAERVTADPRNLRFNMTETSKRRQRMARAETR